MEDQGTPAAAPVLAVDTSTDRESVAVVRGGEVLGEVRLRAGDGHSRRVLPAVDFLLGGLGLGPRDLMGFAVTQGPGSFTGLRVGLSTVQGLALAAGTPCIGLCTLDVMAARVAGRAACVAAMMDAYRGQVFGALYDGAGRLVSERVAEDPRAFLARLPEEALVIGDGARRYAELVAEVRPRVAVARDDLFLAGTLGRLAAPLLAAGEGVPPGELRPLYLRGADIRPPAA
jgi:tRNA threonylcarbamoyladenosine biosynthesis protein TsaB